MIDQRISTCTYQHLTNNHQCSVHKHTKNFIWCDNHVACLSAVRRAADKSKRFALGNHDGGEDNDSGKVDDDEDDEDDHDDDQQTVK